MCQDGLQLRTDRKSTKYKELRLCLSLDKSRKDKEFVKKLEAKY